MYKIIDKLPDDINENKIEERYMSYIYDFYPEIRELRMIGPSEDEIKENIKKNFSNVPEDYKIDDTTLIFESNLNISSHYYFFNPSKNHHIKYLYDEKNEKYLKIKYKKI